MPRATMTSRKQREASAQQPGRAASPLDAAGGDRPPDADSLEEGRWRAVMERDMGQDGAFVYAVRTTGVYCRPSCPSRRALRANVSYFADGEAATRAGFRACLRCRPDEVDARQRMVAAVMRLLETEEPTPGLARLGEAVGLSPTHLQRAFKRATGLSPREYAAAHRATRLKSALRADEVARADEVTRAGYDAGYGSGRGLHEGGTAALGMTPGAYRRGGSGERIAYGMAESVAGAFLVAATARGVCAVRFGEEEALVAELAREFPRALLVRDPEGVAGHLEAVAAHLASPSPLAMPLDVAGTPFQERVWAALREIPAGETRSYAEVARMIGRPSATRAVARACATNPVALAIPCHRVVRTGGEPGGYRWGLARKRDLLAREAARQPC